MRKIIAALMLALCIAVTASAEMAAVQDMPICIDEEIPALIGGAVTLTTEIRMDGTARTVADDQPYETLTFEISCQDAKGPLYFFDTYHNIYQLKYNEAVVPVDIKLVGYTGTQTIIPQQCMLITLVDETQSVIRKGYQLMDYEIDGTAQVAVASDYPVTLYKRYAYDEAADDPMMKYLAVTTYVGGVESTRYFELFEETQDDTFRLFTVSLSKGSEGTAVRILQERLISLGLLSGVADGTFGSGTETAVKTAQGKLGLEQTGVADGQFMKVLLNRG